MRSLVFAGLWLLSLAAYSQVVNVGTTDRYDSLESGKIIIGGYVDTYYGFCASKPRLRERPYSVSASRHNEMNVNLAYAELKYTNQRVRGRFVPAFGTYMNANYAAEQGTHRHLLEANAGVCLSQKRNIWMDAGVLGAPYTNETAISKDHLLYTRSFSVEYSPYYISGVKLSMPIHSKLNAYLYLINGWQQIYDVNNSLAISTQLEYRPNNHWLINWNTYAGDERSAAMPHYRNRYFSDVYCIYQRGKWSATACAYAGVQQRVDSAGKAAPNAVWWQANVGGEYHFSKTSSLSARAEWFSDPKAVQIMPVSSNTAQGFAAGSTSLCLNVRVTGHALLRLEDRFSFSNQAAFLDAHQRDAKRDNLLIANLTIWF